MTMKKYIFMIASLLTLGLATTSCDVMTNEPEGGNKIGDMAGHWEVTIDVVDEDGNILYEDPYGMGVVDINTYATVNDDTDKMWLYDGSFWGLQLLVPINLDAHTFAVTDVPYDLAETGNTTLKGKIIPKGGKNLHGMPVDSICIDAVFDDDPNGGLIWRYSGIRYQGFTE